jgi:hypothetical protein
MNRKEPIKEYKNSVRPMGRLQVKNITNGRIYITASANTTGTINSIRFQLKMGAFLPNSALAKDWNEMGEQRFVLEVLEVLKLVDDLAHDYRDDLKALEASWLEKLKPFGAQGYH